MIAVIQCASRKRSDAGHLRTGDGRKVLFVANPDAATVSDDYIHARPDDVSDSGHTWRTALREYNSVRVDNPHGILPAWQLYDQPIYRKLHEHFGPNRLYILSAGWGLISANFLTPMYDITFSSASNVDPYKRRYRREVYRDFSMLPTDVHDPIVFFGGKSYVPLFCKLTKNAGGPRYLFYNSKQVPQAPGCVPQRFVTRRRTNWHYECANAFVEGEIQVEEPHGVSCPNPTVKSA